VLGVNRSSYYKRFHGVVAARTLENQQLRRLILTIYNNSRQRFGTGKIRACLLAEHGINISAGRVYRLMKGMDLRKMYTRKPPKAARSQSDENAQGYVNRLNRQFNPKAPNLSWVGDITYIKSSRGMLYVCVIIDLFARKLIAWKVSDKPNEALVSSTLRQAYERRGKPENVLFHTDRGCQYTSIAFRRLLDEFKFIQSFSKKGTPYDNAVAESFFKYLKLEQTNRSVYVDCQELERALFEYAHFYNNRRPHSANDNLTPFLKEEGFAASRS
jgi:putative transposase